MNIGETIKKIRKEKKISQKDLAFLCHISQNTLCQIEIGNSFPKKETIANICKYLDISVAELLLETITEDDLAVDKREIFFVLKDLIKKNFKK